MIIVETVKRSRRPGFRPPRPWRKTGGGLWMPVYVELTMPCLSLLRPPVGTGLLVHWRLDEALCREWEVLGSSFSVVYYGGEGNTVAFPRKRSYSDNTEFSGRWA